ncbi:MAG TPA: hypothetical protein PKV71_03655 [Calditrichia bacterium]|nr:hypothetical protein [Calditrichia bacterium]
MRSFKSWAPLLLSLTLYFACSPAPSSLGEKAILEFPESGVDDPATYQGYTTRFYQDSQKNTVQVYLQQTSGRVVNLWADAANESISFTVRDGRNQPVPVSWGSPGAHSEQNEGIRTLAYTLQTGQNTVVLGHFLLNTMRLERDFQHFKKHLEPFDAPAPAVGEWTGLIDRLETLPDDIAERHLALLNAEDGEALSRRLSPTIALLPPEEGGGIRLSQPTLDGKNLLTLSFSVDPDQVEMEKGERTVTLTGKNETPVVLHIRISTDSPPLQPLSSADIFNEAFVRFYEASQTAGGNDPEALKKFRRLDRQSKSMELMSFGDKLFAGLPNYATYFGRDMMMSALMLEPVVKPDIQEDVIAAVLRKLRENGEVSHEEGLGSQAIRENAAVYNRLIDTYREFQRDNPEKARQALAEAEAVLGNLQKATENYHMVDDDFQLPVLAGRYLKRTDIGDARKRAFLEAPVAVGSGDSRLAFLLKNLNYVANVSHAYAARQEPQNLISFRQLGEHHWHAGSWRDSGVGYANGRYAMDINVVWVPQALASLEGIMNGLRGLGFSTADLQAAAPVLSESLVLDYAAHPETLHHAVATWKNTARHFEVSFSPQEVQEHIAAKLNSLPEGERQFWEAKLAGNPAARKTVSFLALSLDEEGRPIAVAHSDVATWLYLEDLTGQILAGNISSEAVLAGIRLVHVDYPVGLMIPGAGPAVANDAYAPPSVWQAFQSDLYHSPRVIWGREVNLLFLGLARQINAAYREDGQLKDPALADYVGELRGILEETLAAVEASGLKDNEVWSYAIEGGRIVPKRHGYTTDIQLWNLTDLAVQYELANLKGK